MSLPRNAVLLRIYIGELAQHNHRPVYETLVVKAREHHLAGATVLRGPMGYGHSSKLHTAKILRLSDDLPVVVEIVDTEENIERFLPVVTEIMEERGLVTLEKVQVLLYGPVQPEQA